MSDSNTDPDGRRRIDIDQLNDNLIEAGKGILSGRSYVVRMRNDAPGLTIERAVTLAELSRLIADRQVGDEFYSVQRPVERGWPVLSVDEIIRRGLEDNLNSSEQVPSWRTAVQSPIADTIEYVTSGLWQEELDRLRSKRWKRDPMAIIRAEIEALGLRVIGVEHDNLRCVDEVRVRQKQDPSPFMVEVPDEVYLLAPPQIGKAIRGFVLTALRQHRVREFGAQLAWLEVDDPKVVAKLIADGSELDNQDDPGTDTEFERCERLALRCAELSTALMERAAMVRNKDR